MKKDTVLILGGRSDIGTALAHQFAQHGFDLQIAARRAKELKPMVDDLTLRHGINVSLHEFDALDLASHAKFVKSLPLLPSIAICTVGHLGGQKKGQDNTDELIKTIRSNYEGPMAILEVLAGKFEARGSGMLIGISSVAGLRGRGSNYIYGSAKAGFTAFLSGLRNRLAPKGVHVMTVLPGFVDTKMIKDIKTPRLLTANAGDLSRRIYRGAMAQKDIVIYKRWWLVMAVICSIPERIFKKLSL